MDNERELTNLKNNFIKVIDDEIRNLTELVEIMDNQSNKVTKFLDDVRSEKERAMAQIKLLEEHKKEIEQGNYNLGNGPVTERLEEKIVEKNNLVNSLQEQINALEQRKGTEDLSDKEKSIIDAQISYKQKMIDKLKSKVTKLSNRQKSIVAKKVSFRKLRDRMIAKQMVRVAKNENKVETLEAKQESLSDGVVDTLRENALETRKSFHDWKAGFDRDVLDKLQRSRLTGIAGARAIAIGKVALDRLRGRITNRRSNPQNDVEMMLPTQTPVQTATANTL